MTISGVKNVLNTKINKLDDYNSNSLKADYQLRVLNKKSKKVLEKIKKLKLLWQKKHT